MKTLKVQKMKDHLQGELKGHIWYLDTIDAFLHPNYSFSEPWCCIDKHTYLSL